jgi:diadenosine tetraphosphate (Ap4A) HIT family hydrolase
MLMIFKLDQTLEKDSYTLGSFPLCRLLLMNDHQYPWFTLVPKRVGVRELYELSEDDQQALWRESRQLSLAIMDEYQGDKLNVAAIGNIVTQLHLHHVVRFKADACWPKPIWGQLPMIPYSTGSIEKISVMLNTRLKAFGFITNELIFD